MTSFFLARGTKFWHARDAHVPLEYAKYKTFQCSSYAQGPKEKVARQDSTKFL